MTGPDESGPASVSPSASPVDDSGAPVDDEDAPPASGPVSARDADEGAPPSSGTFTRIHAAIYQFAGSRKPKEGRDFVLRVIKEGLGPDVSGEIVEEVVQATLAEALECRWLPWFEHKVPAWFARITRRQIARYFYGDERRDRKPKPGQPKKPDPTARPHDAVTRNVRLANSGDDAAPGERVDPAERTDWVPDHRLPPTDERARARLLHDWLAKHIGDDPRDVKTLELMKEHAVDGFTLAELAARERTTERALANRFHKLRKELGPRVRRMDDERTRRSVFLALILLGFGVFVALLLWLLGVFTPPAPPAVPPHEAAPSATVVAPPVFNQALPTPSSSEVPVGPKP
jgi:DNA-directed RNA polymerase specialized sigma24 family protein